MDVRLADCGKRQSDYVYVLSPGLQDGLGRAWNRGRGYIHDEFDVRKHLQNVLRLGEGFVAVIVAGSNGRERQTRVPYCQLPPNASYPLILIFGAQWAGDNRKLAARGKQALGFIRECVG